MSVEGNLIETMDYLWPEIESISRKKRIPSERASQEEQNGTNFSLIAPSGEE